MRFEDGGRLILYFTPEQPVCDRCRPRVHEIYAQKLVASSQADIEWARMWTTCQRCAGTVATDVLCTNSDCVIFFRRKRAQKDAEEASKTLSRFDVSW